MSDDGPDHAALERVERDAWQDLFAAAPARTAEELGLEYRRVGEIGLLACAAIPITELNRAMAVDLGHTATEAELEEARNWLGAHATSGWAFQVGPAAREAPTRVWLRGRGLAPGGNGWAKFVRDAAPPGRHAAALDLREAEAGNAEAFGLAVHSGFGLPPATAPWFAALVGRPGWRTYAVFDGAEPSAAGAMYVKDGLAWVGITATLPAFRRRGAQAAVIARCLADGRAMGAVGFTAEAGYPADGDDAAFTSYRNFLRAGFALAYVRPNYKAA